jgi:hypothetical protein
MSDDRLAEIAFRVENDAAEVELHCHEDVPYLLAEVERLRGALADARAAILDIDAHAAPLGEDADGFVTGGYIVSVGSLHRALGVVGHSSAKCVDVPCERSVALRAALTGLYDATDYDAPENWHTGNVAAFWKRHRAARAAAAVALGTRTADDATTEGKSDD